MKISEQTSLDDLSESGLRDSKMNNRIKRSFSFSFYTRFVEETLLSFAADNTSNFPTKVSARSPITDCSLIASKFWHFKRQFARALPLYSHVERGLHHGTSSDISRLIPAPFIRTTVSTYAVGVATIKTISGKKDYYATSVLRRLTRQYSYVPLLCKYAEFITTLPYKTLRTSYSLLRILVQLTLSVSVYRKISGIS